MSTPTKPDPIYALLAMDAYNRGYGASVSDGKDKNGAPVANGADKNGLGGDGAWLVSAEIIKESGVVEGDPERDAGFYAVAYEVNGKTVISIRGTDNFTTDVLSGYGVGAGHPDGEQAKMAIKFYQQVVADKRRADCCNCLAGSIF